MTTISEARANKLFVFFCLFASPKRNYTNKYFIVIYTSGLWWHTAAGIEVFWIISCLSEPSGHSDPGQPDGDEVEPCEFVSYLLLFTPTWSSAVTSVLLLTEESVQSSKNVHLSSKTDFSKQTGGNNVFLAGGTICSGGLIHIWCSRTPGFSSSDCDVFTRLADFWLQQCSHLSDSTHCLCDMWGYHGNLPQGEV